MNERHMAKAFKEADKNNDGLLDLDEYMGIYKANGVNMTKEDAQALFLDKDKDHDHLISYEEFAGKLTTAEKAWKALDTNKNGFLTKAEITLGVKKYKKSLPSALTKSTQENNDFIKTLNERLTEDTDQISYEEFCKLFQESARLLDEAKSRPSSIVSSGRKPDAGFPSARSPPLRRCSASKASIISNETGKYGGSGASKKTNPDLARNSGTPKASSASRGQRDGSSTSVDTRRFSRHMSVD